MYTSISFNADSIPSIKYVNDYHNVTIKGNIRPLSSEPRIQHEVDAAHLF